jgi:hypothetical protein
MGAHPNTEDAITKTEVLIAHDLVAAVIAHDRTEFDAVYEANAISQHNRLRAHLSGIGATLAFSSLGLRRLTRHLPDDAERDEILCDLDSSTFSDRIDMSVAYPLLWRACGSDERFEAKNTDLCASTCLVIGATLLDRHAHHWSLRYSMIFGLKRHGALATIGFHVAGEV